MSEPYLVALDVDGTIVHEDNTLSPSVYEAINEAEEAGHQIVIATGRSFPGTFEICERLDIRPELLVAANGALIMRRTKPEFDDERAYEIDHVETFDPGPVLEIVRERLPEGQFMVENAEGLRRFTHSTFGWDISHGEHVAFEELAIEPAMRVVVMSPSHATEDFLEIVESMGLHQVSYNVGFTSWLDLAPEGVNKATGLARVNAELGYHGSRIFSAGDGRNDIEMFEWTVDGGGVAVAMGQAPPVVTAAANHRTGTVAEDGLVKALRTHVLRH